MGNLQQISVNSVEIQKPIVVKIRRIIFSIIMGSVLAAWPSKYNNSDQG